MAEKKDGMVVAIGVGKPKPAAERESRSEPMGEEPEMGSSSFEASMQEAESAAKTGDWTTCFEALRAAITAKCADMYTEG